MNIFALDDDPAAAARSLRDQHTSRRYYAAEKMNLRGKPVTRTRRDRPVWLAEAVS